MISTDDLLSIWRQRRWFRSRRAVRAAAFAGIILQILAFGLSKSEAAAADEEADFYRGKSISLLIGFPPGGGYDAYGRLLSRYYGTHIPGNPTIVIRNMAGASGVLCGNYLYEVAARDGTVISLFNNAMPTYELLKDPGVRYKSTGFSWIGSVDSSNTVIVVTGDAGVKTVEDLKRREVLMGAVSASGTMAWYPAMMNNLLGTRFKIVLGYEGGNAINLAMERGEVNGVGSSPWTTWLSRRPDWIKSGWIIPVAQAGIERDPSIPAPLLTDLAPDEHARKIIRLISTDIGLGRMLVAPPQLPEARLNTLRRALDATMADAKLRAEAKASELDIFPVPGAKIAALVAEKMATPPDLLAESVKAISVKGYSTSK
jgi:tripartite-type tricarboxylate transporter receptor subunit TctC